jgi:MFS family permease
MATAFSTDDTIRTGTRGPLSVLLLASTLTVMAGAILTPVLDAIRTDLQVSGTQVGLIITAHGLAIALASPPVGWAIDRYGIRGPLTWGLVGYGLTGGAGLVIDSYPLLIASRLLFGVAAAAVFAGTTVALLNLFQGEMRDRVMGWRSTAISIGGVLWPLLAGVVGGVSWHAPFAIYLVGVPLGLATLLILPSAAGRSSNPTYRGQRILPALRRFPVVLGFYALVMVCAVLLYGIAVFIPLRLAQIGVGEPFLIALIGVNVSVAMSLVGLVYARLRAAASYPALLLSAAGLWAASFLVLGTTNLALLVLVALALFGAGMGLAIPATTVLVSDTLPEWVRGRGMALLGTVTFSGQFLSPIILGPVVDATSITTGFLACAGLSVLLLVVLALPASRASIDRAVRDGPAAPPERIGPAPDSGPAETTGP